MGLEEELMSGVQIATPQVMADLSKLIEAAAETQKVIEFHEEALKAAKAELHNITTKSLPDMLAAAKTTSHTTDAGVKVEIKDFINASLPKEEDKRSKALAWLNENGAGDIIKTQIEVSLGKGEHNIAGAVVAELEKLGVAFTKDEGVHPQTLAAFIRERLKAGQDVDLETLGAFAGRHAKITLPKGDVKKVSKPKGRK